MTSEDSKTNSGGSYTGLIIFIIAIVCYCNIDDSLVKTCSVTEQKNFLLYQWITSDAFLGLIIISSFILCGIVCSSDGSAIFMVAAYVFYFLEIIAQLLIMINLWVQDPLVSKLQLHSCSDGKDYTIVTAIQVI